MAWLFAQMWGLEVAAFLLGAAVTWLVFVRPARAAARLAQPVHLPPAWATEPARREPDPPPAQPSPTFSDPALAELDAHSRHSHRRTGLFATGVLDEIESTSPLPVVPAQGAPPAIPEPR
jgi:hypothetical protein